MSGPRRCLVSRTSATSCLSADVSLDNSIAIRRTHSNLVKFASHDDEYRNVAYILGRLQRTSINYSTHTTDTHHMETRRQSQVESQVAVEVAPLLDRARFGSPVKRPAEETLPPPKRPRTGCHPTENKSPHNEIEALKPALVAQLYFLKIDKRLIHLTSAQGTTYRFLSKPEYAAWHDPSQRPEHGGFLWIKGNPETGKSTLMKFLFEKAKSSTNHGSSQITLSFFFLARGTIEEKTVTGLYRSLLHQLFQKASKSWVDDHRWCQKHPTEWLAYRSIKADVIPYYPVRNF